MGMQPVVSNECYMGMQPVVFNECYMGMQLVVFNECYMGMQPVACTEYCANTCTLKLGGGGGESKEKLH